MKAVKALLLILVMAAGLIALAIGLRGPYARLAAEHWQEQLDSVPDERARALLEQAAELGEQGIPVLVAALGSERESVARAGSQVLAEQLHRWQNLPGRGSTQKQALLAEALAERVGQFGPAARSEAAQLATEILLCLPEGATIDRSLVITACEKVLRAGPERAGGSAEEGMPGQFPPEGSLRRPLPPGTDLARAAPSAPGDPMLPEPSITAMARLPGGGLPMPSSDGSADAQPRTPGLLAQAPESRPLDPLRQPGALGGQGTSGPQNPLRGGQPSDARPVQPSRVDNPSAAPRDARVQGPTGDLTGVDTVVVMRQLHSADPAAVAAARSELVRRKFSAVHLNLARRLFDPDPEVRKELARMLPGVAGVDAVPWLLWLGRDQDAEVRLVAITLMATTGDPTLLGEIEKMAQEDPDPRIQQRAERISQQRNERRRY
jgi:hypothetical protein